MTKTHILNLIKHIKLLRVIISLENSLVDFIVIFIIIINATLIKQNVMRNTVHLPL